jgi:hypothetical protein
MAGDREATFKTKSERGSLETLRLANPRESEIEEFVDERQGTWCIHCARPLVGLETNEDHVPSKSLLTKPRPHHPPIVTICREWNTDVPYMFPTGNTRSGRIVNSAPLLPPIFPKRGAVRLSDPVLCVGSCFCPSSQPDSRKPVSPLLWTGEGKREMDGVSDLQTG